MTKVTDDPLPFLPFTETVDPSNPAAGGQRLFVDTDHQLKMVDSSGTVTTFSSSGAIPNPLSTDSLWDAKGDLVAATGANAAAKVTAGTDHVNVLVPDSGQSTGVRWATYAGCRVYHNTTQTVNAAATDAMLFNSEEHDSNAFHDTGSNTSRITIPTGYGGLYVVSFGIYGSYQDLASFINLRKNGTTTILGSQTYANQTTAAHMLHRTLQIVLAAADYLEVMLHNDHTANVNFGHASAAEVQSTFSAHLVR